MRITVLLSLLVLAVLGGCSTGVECFDVTARDCQRVAQAAIRSLPSGHTRLVIDGSARRVPPYPVFACYPDGSQVVVGVTLTGAEERVEPLTGMELASCD